MKPATQPVTPQLEVHEHWFVSGPRGRAGYHNGIWREPKFKHSHPGGDVPHRHPDTGPSSYGHRPPKTTKRPTGEQFEIVPMSEEDQSFDLVITDSALMSVDGKLVPIGEVWTYTQDGDGDHAIWNGEELIAVTDGWGIYISEVRRTREEDEANARLISSAPELLRVAKDAADFLLRTARVLDEWAVQSQNGGWSTHQVEGNLRVANDCRREAYCIQRVIDRATGAEGTRP
jgi:hypothetical protein